MPTTIAHTMMDDSILSVPQIEAKIREVERHVAALERLEKILGPLHIDAEPIRLMVRDKRRHYCEQQP